MPTPKHQEDKKTSLYKEESAPNAGTPYKAPDNIDSSLIGLPTTVFKREGFRNYWAREDEVNVRLMEGYEVASPSNYPHLSRMSFQWDTKKRGSVIRIPSKDSNEELILMEITDEAYAIKKAKQDIDTDWQERGLVGRTKSRSSDGAVTESDGFFE